MLKSFSKPASKNGGIATEMRRLDTNLNNSFQVKLKINPSTMTPTCKWPRLKLSLQCILLENIINFFSGSIRSHLHENKLMKSFDDVIVISIL